MLRALTRLTCGVTLLLVIGVTGCSGTASAGPTCQELLEMSDADRTDAIVEWADDHDERVDQDNPNQGSSGFAAFQDRGGLMIHCQDHAHRDQHIGDLSPAG